LITGRNDQQDGYDAIIALMSWEKFCTSVAEAEALARPEEFDAYKNLGEHYAGVRRWSPSFLEAFVFESVAASASLMRAIEVLREATLSEKSSLPESAPTGFVRQRWAAQVMPGGTIDRRYYELCVLSELRDRLRAGDVWVQAADNTDPTRNAWSHRRLWKSSNKAATCRSPSRRISRSSSRPAGLCSMSE